MTLSSRFRVALTADFFDANGNTKYRDIGLDLFKSEPRIEWTPFDSHKPEITVDQLQGFNGVIVLTPRVSAASLAASQDLLAVGRFGVGFDGVDVSACTASDVALFITAGAVDHSVAEATVGWMLALTHHMRIKDMLVRTGDWDTRSRYMGSELRDRTLGLVGFGGIGQSVVRLLKTFGMNQPLIYDPFVSAEVIEQSGVKQVSLVELLTESDFVSLHCPLNDRTRNLLTGRELGLMKPTAYLLNTARGGIVDEDALFEALSNHRIAGAALDCFVGEPIITPNQWSNLDNVILAPHSIAWTEELFRDIGRTVCKGMLDFSCGRRPRGVINPEVFERPGFIEKWNRLSKK